MATFILIHGAWVGGWVWRNVEQHLRIAGHEVFRPSLTGLGDRAHLLSETVDLECHVTDVVNLIKWERLQNITLVGHSYGGMVVTAVADRLHDHVGSLIYLDAFIPQSGQSQLELLPPEGAAIMRNAADQYGQGWFVPVPAPETGPFRQVREVGEVNLLNEFCTAQPLATFTQKISLSGNSLMIPKHAYMFASGYGPSPFRPFMEESIRSGWQVEELRSHHFPMLSMPRETTEFVLRHKAEA